MMSCELWLHALLLLLTLCDAAHLRPVRLTSSFTSNVALKRQVDYTLQLSNFENVQYSGAFTIGQQTLPVVYDTGSFEVLVLSEKCYSCSAVLKKYDSRLSASFESSGGIEASHMFGSGPVRSEKGYEHLYLGDTASPYHVQHAPFWQILDHQIPAWDDSAIFAGIVGLSHTPQVPAGFGAEQATNEITLLASLQVDFFSFCLQRSGDTSPGWFSVGPGVQSTLSTRGFSAIPVVGQVHWGVQMTHFHIPGVTTANPCSPSCGVIVDTGTSLIAVPPSMKGAINALQRMLNSDCSNLDSMPVLQFMLGDVAVELPPRAYVMKVSQLGVQIPLTPKGIWEMIWDGPRWKSADQCHVSFMVMEKHSDFGPVWILGMPFLRYYYTIFERTAKKIHIARASPDCNVELPGAAGLMNISSFNGTGSRHYSSLDYQPEHVDLKSARWPEWATAPGNDTLLI